jgi:diguanylate cyclase (GGDEF)-like protein
MARSIPQAIRLTLALALIGAVSAAAGVGVLDELFSNRSTTTRWFGAMVGGAIVAGYIGWIVLPMVVRRRIEPLESANRMLTAQVLTQSRRRSFGEELDEALAQAGSEAEVLTIIKAALHRLDPDRPVELHLVDPYRPVLLLAFSTFETDDPTQPVSPWDSIAARTGKTYTYDTTSRLDTCGHLASRVGDPASAICVPVTAMGRILGVLYSLGPNNSEPTVSAVDAMMMVADRAGSHLAIVRSFTDSEPRPTDPLTGLPNEFSTETEIRSLVASFTPFTIAIGAIDGFDEFLDEHDRVVGEEAIVQFSSVLSDATRPGDILGRLSDQELIAVFPNATPSEAVRVLERVRENLALHFAATAGTNFTISFGVTDSSSASSIEQIVDNARNALTASQAIGRNRVLVTEVSPDDKDHDRSESTDPTHLDLSDSTDES